MIDKSIVDILEKRNAGERLYEQDALALFNSPDLWSIAHAADEINRNINNDRVYFNVNRHINPTNICAHTCKFCAFSRKPGDEGGYAYSTEEMVQKAEEAVKQGATEVHMVGGLHPRWSFDVYLGFIRAIKDRFPSLHIKAFTSVELAWIAKKARLSLKEVLLQLREAGLDSLPGGGAEIFHPEVREIICDTKLTAEGWIDIHKMAHEMGIRSNATMLYGHIEHFRHRVHHMRLLRDLQDVTGGFNVFIPLAFQPYNNQMGISRYTYSFDDLKTIAVARLFLDNFQNIKAYWVMMGQDVAQLALSCGANDLDGTVNEEKISHMAGGKAGMTMNRSELESIIYQAGKIPQERDTLYNPIGLTISSRNSLDSDDYRESSTNYFDANPFLQYSDDDDYEVWVKLLKSRSISELGMHAQKVKSRAKRDFNSQGYCLTKEVHLDYGRTLVQVCQILDKLSPQIRDIAGVSFTLDLGAHSPISFPEFLILLETINDRWEIPVRIRGISELKILILEEEISFAKGLRQIARRGTVILQMDRTDTHRLSAEDLRVLAKAAHEADLKWVASVKIPVGYVDHHGQILHHIEFLKALALLYEDYQNILALEVTHAAGVSAVDYLKAVALSRILLPPDMSLITPLGEIPASSRVELAIEEGKLQPQKLTSIVPLMGSDDFGPIDIDSLDQVSLYEEIYISSREPELRDIWLRPCRTKYIAHESRKIKDDHFTSMAKL